MGNLAFDIEIFRVDTSRHISVDQSLLAFLLGVMGERDLQKGLGEVCFPASNLDVEYM